MASEFEPNAESAIELMFRKINDHRVGVISDVEREMLNWIITSYGSTEVTSNPDGGCTFHFELPQDAVDYVNQRLSGAYAEPPEPKDDEISPLLKRFRQEKLAGNQ